MKRLIVAVTLFSLVTGGDAVAAKDKGAQTQQFVVYYVNMQEVINESNKGQQAKAILQSKVAKVREEIKKKEESIKKLEEELKSPILSAQAKADKETQLQQEELDLKRYRQDKEIEISNLEKQYTVEIIKDVVNVVSNYQKEKKIPMIVESREAGIIAADPRYDLTKTIIKLYNQQSK